MRTNRRKAALALLLMGGAAALAEVARPSIKLADTLPPLDLEGAFPAAFGDWLVDPSQPVILPAPDVQAKLNAIYNKVLSRTYVNRRTGARIMLSVAYGGDQSDGMNVHLPEVCYPAQGFAVRSRRLDRLQAGTREIPVVRLVTRLGPRTEPVTYWITVGNAVVPTRTDQKLAQIRYGLEGVIPDGMLVRVSSIDSDERRAFETHGIFVTALVLALPEPVSPRIVGAG